MALVNRRSSDGPTVVAVVRVHALRGLNRAQELTLDAADVVLRATKSSPVSDLPTPSKLPGVPSLDAATRFTFDFATEVLNSQRDFALRLTRALRSK